MRLRRLIIGLLVALMFVAGYLVVNRKATNYDNYSLEEFPLAQSPIFSNLSETCKEMHKNSEDIRVLSDKNRVVVSSLYSEIFRADQKLRDLGCASEIRGYYIKNGTSYWFFDVYVQQKSQLLERVGIYKLDLNSGELKEIKISDILPSNIDEHNNVMLTDKRIVSWRSGDIRIFNLFKDEYQILFESPENRWLVEEIEFGLGWFPKYNVQVTENEVVFGLYDSTLTEDGKKITFPSSGVVEIDGKSQGTHKSRLVQRLTLPIPKDY